MRAVRRLLSGGAAPGPSRVLAAVLLVTSFLAVAAPRVLEIFQTRVLRETLAAAPAVDRSISVTSGYVTSGRARGHGVPAAARLTATTSALRQGTAAAARFAARQPMERRHYGLPVRAESGRYGPAE